MRRQLGSKIWLAVALLMPAGASAQIVCALGPGASAYKPASDQRKQHTLGQQLTNDLRPAGTHGYPNGKFAAAYARSSEEQISDIHAGDQEYETDRAEKDKQDRPHVTHDFHF